MSSNPYIHFNSIEVVQHALNRLSQKIGSADKQLLDQLEYALQFRDNQDSTAPVQNTYLKDFEIPQIKLFDILANHFPLVVESQNLAHACLLKEAKDRSHLCIIDLGIGRSVQILRLLKLLHEVPSIAKVTLIGVDIMQEALRHSAQVLESEKTKLNFAFDFHLIQSAVEKIDFNEILNRLPQDRDFTYINSSLTLHHVQHAEERNS
ncbi:MAG: hypothetical protein RL131_589, partial [Bacteroidota bacterium]